MIESSIVYGGKNFKGQPSVTIISIHIDNVYLMFYGVYNVYKMFWGQCIFLNLSISQSFFFYSTFENN